MFHLSQGQLTLLETCPRKFQYICLEQLGFPIAPEQQERLSWGDRFHRLMQQREMGLPLHNLVDVDQPIQRSMEAFVGAASDLFQTDTSLLRQSEHRRTLHLQGYLLTVIYDLLILGEHQAQILDWKTYPRPQQLSGLAQRWQTRLYPFVLAETSHYQPDQISMTYWFIQAAPEPQPKTESCQFVYSTAVHHNTSQALAKLLDQLTEWLQRYEADEPLPQVSESSGHCATCSFAMRCQRGQMEERALPLKMLDLTEIEEIVL